MLAPRSASSGARRGVCHEIARRYRPFLWVRRAAVSALLRHGVLIPVGWCAIDWRQASKSGCVHDANIPMAVTALPCRFNFTRSALCKYKYTPMTISMAASPWRNGFKTSRAPGLRVSRKHHAPGGVSDRCGCRQVRGRRQTLPYRGPRGRPPAGGRDAEADKMATAFISAVDKLTRALDADLGRVKDRHGRDTIRDAQE